MYRVFINSGASMKPGTIVIGHLAPCTCTTNRFIRKYTTGKNVRRFKKFEF